MGEFCRTVLHWYRWRLSAGAQQAHPNWLLIFRRAGWLVARLSECGLCSLCGQQQHPQPALKSCRRSLVSTGRLALQRLRRCAGLQCARSHVAASGWGARQLCGICCCRHPRQRRVRGRQGWPANSRPEARVRGQCAGAGTAVTGVRQGPRQLCSMGRHAVRREPCQQQAAVNPSERCSVGSGQAQICKVTGLCPP